MEFRGKELGDFDSEEDGGEVEDYAVRNGGNEDVWVGEQFHWGEKVAECKWIGADGAEVEIFAAEG